MTTRVVAGGDQQQQSAGKGLGRRRLYFVTKVGWSCIAVGMMQVMMQKDLRMNHDVPVFTGHQLLWRVYMWSRLKLQVVLSSGDVNNIGLQVHNNTDRTIPCKVHHHGTPNQQYSLQTSKFQE
jgi:hypothetical protein